MRVLPIMPRLRLVLAAAVSAAAISVGHVRAYDVPLNTHKIDFWDTNQVVGWPERPVPRAHHSVTYLRRMIFVFGGVDADDTILGDLHFYDTVTRRWSGEIAREWCCDERGQVVDVERGYQPPATRCFHAAVADEQAGRLYVLGGYNGEAGELGDVQYFDPAQMRWSGSLDISGPAPLARSGHVAFLGPGGTGTAGGGGEGEAAIYVFGGYSSTGGHLNDLHKLSLTTNDFRWSEVAIARTTFGGGTGGATHSPPPRPSPRRHAAAAVAWLPGSVSVVISGGIRAPTVTRGSGQGGGNETAGSALVFGDVWQLEFVGARAAWQKLDVSGGDSAGGGLPRFHHTCISSQDGTRFVITGGRYPNRWSSPTLSSSASSTSSSSSTSSNDEETPTSRAAAAADRTEENVEEGILPPLAHTLTVIPGGSASASLTWTPGSPGSSSPSDPCRAPSGFTEAPLLQVSEDDSSSDSTGLSVVVGRYGHAATLNDGYMYEFGGFVETEKIVTAAGEGERGLIAGGLRVSYLAEGGDGRLCPVWVQSV